MKGHQGQELHHYSSNLRVDLLAKRGWLDNQISIPLVHLSMLSVEVLSGYPKQIDVTKIVTKQYTVFMDGGVVWDIGHTLYWVIGRLDAEDTLR